MVMKSVLLNSLLSILLMVNGLSVWGQTLSFSSNKGTLAIVGTLDGSPIVGKSSNLFVQLDYERGEIEMKISPKTLVSGNDSLDRFLDQVSVEIITFNGKLGIDYIKTEDHPVQRFEVIGEVMIRDSSFSLPGKGSLKHISDEGKIACYLELEFNLIIPKPKQIPLFNEKENFFKIRVIDAILQRE
jgi:hypothetical protein